MANQLVTPPQGSLGFTKQGAGGAFVLTDLALRFLTNITNALNGTKVGAISSVTLGNGSTWSSGAGAPNGIAPGNLGDLYSNTNGGAGQTLWSKESGGPASKYGWVAKQ